jgi:hypothetical protein
MPEKVLLVCTSTVPKVRKALQILKERSSPDLQFDFLCTSAELPNFPSDAFGEVFVFPGRRGFWVWKSVKVVAKTI